MELIRSSETKTRITHVIAGLNICLEGWERIIEGWKRSGGALMTFGILLFLFARFHTRLHHSGFAKHMDSAAFLLESAVLGIIAALYFAHGKHALPWCYTGIALVYLGLAIARRGRESTAAGRARVRDTIFHGFRRRSAKHTQV